MTPSSAMHAPIETTHKQPTALSSHHSVFLLHLVLKTHRHLSYNVRKILHLDICTETLENICKAMPPLIRRAQTCEAARRLRHLKRNTTQFEKPFSVRHRKWDQSPWPGLPQNQKCEVWSSSVKLERDFELSNMNYILSCLINYKKS